RASRPQRRPRPHDGVVCGCSQLVPERVRPEGETAMRAIRRVLPLAVLVLTAAAATAREPQPQAEALSRVGSMKFVPGRLTELVTPPNPANLELSHGYGSLDNLALDNCPPKCQADSDTYLM